MAAKAAMFKIKTKPNEIKPGDKVQVIRFNGKVDAYRVDVGTAETVPGLTTANARGIYELNVDDEPLTLGVRPSGLAYGVVQVDILERPTPQLSEPPIGAVVSDRDGDFWRKSRGSWGTGDHIDSGGDTWEVVCEYAPLTVLAVASWWDENPNYRNEYLEYRRSL